MRLYEQVLTLAAGLNLGFAGSSGDASGGLAAAAWPDVFRRANSMSAAVLRLERFGWPEEPDALGTESFLVSAGGGTAVAAEGGVALD
jgi:hypothetical protein